jgi:hypothetical protein
MANEKYRITFSKPELECLLELCNEKMANGNAGPQLTAARTQLHLFLFKLNNNITRAAYQTQPTLGEQLGIVTSKKELSPMEKQLAAFNKWQSEGATNCSTEELELVSTYRLNNGLMSPEEEAEVFEAMMAAIPSNSSTDNSSGANN